MSKQIKIGVVGCGYWGPNLIRNFRSLPDCHLKMMCDVNEDAPQASCGHCIPRSRARRIITIMLNGAGLDAVVIATAVKPHFPMAKASLLAGKHTFIEKPMAASAAECEELVDIARKNGPGADDRPHVPLFARRQKNQGNRGQGRHRGNPLHLRPPPESWACSRRTSTWPGTSPRTTSPSFCTSWRNSRSR